MKKQKSAVSLTLINKTTVCAHNSKNYLSRPLNLRTFAASKLQKQLDRITNLINNVGASKKIKRITNKTQPRVKKKGKRK
jgi:hypothetical protein